MVRATWQGVFSTYRVSIDRRGSGLTDISNGLMLNVADGTHQPSLEAVGKNFDIPDTSSFILNPCLESLNPESSPSSPESNNSKAHGKAAVVRTRV